MFKSFLFSVSRLSQINLSLVGSAKEYMILHDSDWKSDTSQFQVNTKTATTTRHLLQTLTTCNWTGYACDQRRRRQKRREHEVRADGVRPFPFHRPPVQHGLPFHRQTGRKPSPIVVSFSQQALSLSDMLQTYYVHTGKFV